MVLTLHPKPTTVLLWLHFYLWSYYAACEQCRTLDKHLSLPNWCLHATQTTALTDSFILLFKKNKSNVCDSLHGMPTFGQRRQNAEGTCSLRNGDSNSWWHNMDQIWTWTYHQHFFYPVRNKGWRRMNVHTSLRRTAVFSAMFIQGKGPAVNEDMDVNATHFLKMQ